MSATPVTAMGGRERTQEKQEQMERFKRDSKLAAAMSVCDVEALKAASLKCQTKISDKKPDCAAEIFAYKECIKAIAREQKKERDKVFFGTK